MKILTMCIGIVKENPNSSHSLLIHMPSEIPWDNALNSTSPLLLATTLYFTK